MPPSSDPNQHQHQCTYIHHYHPHTMTTSHRHKKPRSGSPSLCVQCKIATQDPWRDSSRSNATINQTQHIYIHHHHPHTTTPSHRNNKPRFGSPNRRAECEIMYQDPRCNNSIFNANIKERCNNYVYNGKRNY